MADELESALDSEPTAAELQAAIDAASGASGKKVDALLSKARSLLAELLRSEQWKAERVAAGVDQEMGERPENHFCSITGEVMSDPVSDAAGHTYERKAIEQWLQTHDTSPLTGAQLPHRMLNPNQVVKNIIREWEEQEHKRCMKEAQAVAQAKPPPVKHSKSEREIIELHRRKKAQAAKDEAGTSGSQPASS